ncbi:MAG: hypothetical protein GIKADHBN_01856 [Phycisphaerales bacterium]|nr:hypothetical protein [Phycisphaerales bacterium]
MRPINSCPSALRRAAALWKAACKRPPRGFSLIEVLIAVVVLAPGLLGVGPVFPVVIRSQRQSQDVIQGQIAARSASAYVYGRRWLIDGLNELAYDVNHDNSEDDPPEFDATPWYIWGPKGGGAGSLDETNGDVVLPDPETNGLFFIPVSDRLFPQPFSPGVDPQYVWDLAVRRRMPDGIQVVVFTRRLDQQIPVPNGWYLSHVVTGRTDTAAKNRLPIAVDPEGRPTGNGRGEYSRLRTVLLDRWGGTDSEILDPAFITVAEMDDGANNWANASITRRMEALGQKLVDNLGNVYTVVGTRAGKGTASDGGATQWIMIEPSLSRELWQQKLDGAEISFVVSPQIPAAVTVIDLDRKQ